MASVPLTTPRGDPGRLEHPHHARDLELVGHAEGEHGELVEGPHRLVRDRMLGQTRRVDLALVVEERALARHPGLLHQRAVDTLIPEGAHPYAIGRGVAERDGERRLLGDAPALVRETSTDALAEKWRRHAR